MSIETQNVTLRYISASDTSNAGASDYGATRYEIIFDSTIINYCNVIMFEYKLQDISESNENSNFDNTTFGFIAVEHAILSGISNQYILSVPATTNVLNKIVTQTIQVRVYAGQKQTSNKVIITDWSNLLDVYNPPATPNLDSAYFDTVYGSDDLYVILDDDANPDYDYSVIQFVICYFFKDTSGNTVWNISDPQSAVSDQNGKRTITVNNIGEVALENSVYVTAHAAYNWVSYVNDVSNNIYALSYVSDEITAISGDSDNTPNITDVSYNVYSTAPAIPGNQTITVKWIPPGNYLVPAYTLSHYELYYRKIISDTDDTATFIKYGENITDLNALEMIVNIVGNLNVGDLNMVDGNSIQFKVNAKTIAGNDQYSNVSNPIYFFKYSTAPKNLKVLSTSSRGQTSDVIIQFENPDNTGSGNPEQFIVSVNGATGTPVTYDSEAENYSVSLNMLSSDVGLISVYLQTLDTTDTTVVRHGQSIHIPYIARNLSLSSTYKMYSEPRNQDIALNWVLPILEYDSPWTIKKLTIKKTATNDTDNKYNDIEVDANNYNYELLPAEYAVNTMLQFRIVAELQHEYGTIYNIISNTKSLQAFTYAAAVSNLNITETSFSADKVGMTVNFTGLSTTAKGLGDDLQYVIKIDGEIHSTDDTLDYEANKLYSITYTNLNVSQMGVVEVYLQTKDTNSEDLKDGASSSTPYIANNVVLEDITYDVYTDPNDQEMKLSWNSPAIGVSDNNQWNVTGYTVEVKKGDNEWALLIDNDTNNNYTYNAFDDIGDATIELQFRVQANMLHTNTGKTYVLTSNVKSKNTFTYAQAPNNVVITNISYTSGAVGMTVNFTGVSNVDKGLGNGLQYVIKIDGEIHPTGDTLGYEADKLYSIVYTSLDVSQMGVVEVYLQTKDTNSEDSKDGALSSTPYIANNLTLNNITYDVYTYPNVQKMQLSWSNSVDFGIAWSVKYLVHKNSELYVQNISTNTYTYNLLPIEYAAKTNLNFKIIALMTHSTGTVYTVESNAQSLNSFSYPSAPQNVNVNWAVSNSNKSEMDVNVTFKNSSDLGVNNGIDYYKIELFNALSDPISNTTKAFLLGENSIEVNFDNVIYSATGNVRISLYVLDTNNEDRVITSNYSLVTYTSDVAPLFTDVVYDNRIITGKIISATPLLPVGKIPYIWNNNQFEVAKFNTTETTNGMNISQQESLGANGEYIYIFTLDINLFFGLNNVNVLGLAIAVSNTAAGVGVHKQTL